MFESYWRHPVSLSIMSQLNISTLFKRSDEALNLCFFNSSRVEIPSLMKYFSSTNLWLESAELLPYFYSVLLNRILNLWPEITMVSALSTFASPFFFIFTTLALLCEFSCPSLNCMCHRKHFTFSWRVHHQPSFIWLTVYWYFNFFLYTKLMLICCSRLLSVIFANSIR